MRPALLLACLLADASAPASPFDPRSVQRVAELPGTGKVVCSLALSPDGRRLAAGGADGVVRVWALPTPAEPRTIEVDAARVGQVGFSPDSRSVLAYDANTRTVLVLDVEGGRPVGRVEGVSDSLYAFAVSPSGQLAAATASEVRLYDLPARNERIFPASGGNGRCSSAFFSGDGSRLAVVQTDVKLYDVRRERELATLRPASGAACAVAFDPGARRCAVVDTGGTLRVWEAESGRLIHTLKGHVGQIDAVAWSPDGRWVATGGRDGTVRFWDPRRGTEARRLDAHNGIVYSVAFLPTGRGFLSGGGDGKLRLWGPAPRAALEPPESRGGTGYIGITGADSPDGGVLVTSVQEGTAAERFGLENGDVIREFNGSAVQGFVQLANEVRTCREGQSVMLKFKRGGEERELQLKLGARPDEP